MSEASDLAGSINKIASFLAFEQVRDAADLLDILSLAPAEDGQGRTQPSHSANVVVLCGSEVLYAAESVLAAMKRFSDDGVHAAASLQRNLDDPVVLVLCGGLGHSTRLMHEAIARHSRYGPLARQLEGQPEARMLQAIAEQFFGLKVDQSIPGVTGSVPRNGNGLLVVLEDKSTNCGANASRTREVLEAFGVKSPRAVVVAQDPTMCRRTLASFEKVYGGGLSGGAAPRIYSWPTFVPNVRLDGEAGGDGAGRLSAALRYDIPEINETGGGDLWDMRRFLSLLMGEIPRLRDDENGYGPNGKGYIAHVGIPDDVEGAWRLLDGIIGPIQRSHLS